MRAIAALLLFLSIAACTTPQSPQSAQPSLAWRHDGSTSYEAQSPGLGVSNRYSTASGWIDVYEYDLRQSNWENGVADPRFGAHFESIIENIREFGRRGIYAGVTIGSAREVVISGHRFRAVNFRYARDGKPLHSATYLTARNGQLLKYRVSIHAASGLDVDAVAMRFIEDNLRNIPVGTKA